MVYQALAQAYVKNDNSVWMKLIAEQVMTCAKALIDQLELTDNKIDIVNLGP